MFRASHYTWILRGVEEVWVSTSHQVWKWLKTDSLHRRAAHSSGTGSSRSTHILYSMREQGLWPHAGEIMFVVLKTATAAAKGKSKSIVGVYTASPSRQGQTWPWFYVMLITAVRVLHEMFTWFFPKELVSDYNTRLHCILDFLAPL